MLFMELLDIGAHKKYSITASRYKKIIFADCTYTDACQLANLPSSWYRREQLTITFLHSTICGVNIACITCERCLVCYGVERDWFPVLVGPEVGSPTEILHHLHSHFLPTDYGCRHNDGLATGAISVSGRATSGSGLVATLAILVLSEWISARTVTLDRLSRDCERRVIPVDLEWAITISASGRSKRAAPGADTTIDLL